MLERRPPQARPPPAAKVGTPATNTKERKPRAAQMTTVHHIDRAPPGAIYIGRAMPGRTEASKWANPYKPRAETPEARREAIRLYFAHIYSKGLFYHVAELRDKALACWCAPRLCHGDLLAELAEYCASHGQACRHCKTPQTASLIYTGGTIRERAYCSKCRATVWTNKGPIKFFEETEKRLL